MGGAPKWAGRGSSNEPDLATRLWYKKLGINRVEVRMKYVSRDTIKEAISSSSKLYYVLVSIFVVYASAALNIMDRNNAASNLNSLDILYAIIVISEKGTTGAKYLTALDTPRFYRKAAKIAYENTLFIEDIIEKGFPNKPINGGRIKNVPMRLEPAARCDIAVISAAPGTKFNFATSQVVSRSYWVNSEDVSLVSFGHCGFGYMWEFNTILFRTDDQKTVIALPKSFESKFPGLKAPEPFASLEFGEVEKFKETLPPIVQKYADLNGSYITLHIDALRHFILRYATSRTGKFYNVEEFNDAMSALYHETERRTALLGIEATVTQIVRLGPLVILVIAWELWRRIRRIPTSLENESTWFPFDVQSRLYQMIAIIFSMTPVLIGVFVLYFFLVSQQLSLVIFGRMINLNGIMAGNIPIAPPRGWLGAPDYWAATLSVPLIALLALLTFISIKLLAIVWANASNSR